MIGLAFNIKCKTSTQEEQDRIEEYDMNLLDYIVHKMPKLALSIIVRIMEQDCEKKILPVLAAGELENLLSEHGALIIDDVEREAACNPNFKKLLGGVWQADMSDELFQRITDAIGGERNRW